MHCWAMDDMVILAHIREQHRLSLQSYGRPRMTEELQELGLRVGHRRVGRLMRENGIKIIRTQKYKVRRVKDLIQWIKFTDARRTAISSSTLRPIFWHGISTRIARTRNGPAPFGIFSAKITCRARDISYIWTREGWLYLALDHCS